MQGLDTNALPRVLMPTPPGPPPVLTQRLFRLPLVNQFCGKVPLTLGPGAELPPAPITRLVSANRLSHTAGNVPVRELLSIVTSARPGMEISVSGSGPVGK